MTDVDPMVELDLARRSTFGELLRAAARKRPEKIGFRIGDAEISMAALDARADRLGHALESRGIEFGDRVALLMTNRLEMVEAIFAVTRLGAIVVPVNFRLVADEIVFLIQDSGAKAIIVDAGLASLAGQVRARVESLAICLVVGGRVEDAGPGAEPYEEAVAAADTDPLRVDVPEPAPAFIMYTSGTTGLPKGAVLTHMNFAMNAFAVMVALGIRGEDEVWLSGLPLFHVGGVDHILPYVLMAGGTSVILPSGLFSVDEVVDLFEHAGVTGCFFVATQWQAICDHPRMKELPKSLKRIAYGATSTPLPLLEKLAELFPGAEFINAFGQTEMSPNTTIISDKDAHYKMGSVGTPIVNVEVRIVDDQMQDVPRGEVGEIVYRGPGVFAGYWNQPEATAEAFAGGWFHSGDLCRMDEDGFVYVVDRKKDMIISGGENIYSAEIEAVIVTHPKVHEVAVIGVPHEKWGETPRAVIVATDPADPPTREEILEHCRTRLAPYKKPTSVVVMTELPHNASGKVLKPVLRSIAASEQLGPSPAS